MAKKRAKVNMDFSDKSDLFTPTEEIARPKKITPKKRLRARVTYDIGEELKERVRVESVRLGVPASQLAKYLLLSGFDEYENGRLPPPTLLPSKSPAYRFNIDFKE